MAFALVTSPQFADHLTPPGHPERADRADVMFAVATSWRERGLQLLSPRLASREELLRVHSDNHVAAIQRTSGRAVALDVDTYTSPHSAHVASLAAGGACVAVEYVMSHAEPTRACVFVRPPGHHAERERAMGFCLYNNVAIAAAYALVLGARRVAIVDIDVHHGNGTQWIFYEDPRVLFVSTHQYPYYPGTGAAGEAGARRGEGTTVNVPLEAGATDGDYELVFASAVLPILRWFGPDLIFVSAGYDAHARDPLGAMRLSTVCYAGLIARLRDVAEQTTGRLIAATEGGYHLPSFTDCLNATVAVLAPGESPSTAAVAPRGPEASTPDASCATWRGPAAIDLVRAAQKRYWPGL